MSVCVGVDDGGLGVEQGSQPARQTSLRVAAWGRGEGCRGEGDGHTVASPPPPHYCLISPPSPSLTNRLRPLVVRNRMRRLRKRIGCAAKCPCLQALTWRDMRLLAV